jgi:hypothetical protein
VIIDQVRKRVIIRLEEHLCRVFGNVCRDANENLPPSIASLESGEGIRAQAFQGLSSVCSTVLLASNLSLHFSIFQTAKICGKILQENIPRLSSLVSGPHKVHSVFPVRR